MSKAGAVGTHAGNGARGFADGQGAAARFKKPFGVVVLPVSGEFALYESVRLCCPNNALRVVTPGGAVRRLAGGGLCRRTGRSRARQLPCGPDAGRGRERGACWLADLFNHAVRRVSMAGSVSTVAGNWGGGFADV